MKIWKIKIDPDAIEDIRQITEWYNEQKINLGKRFYQSVIKQINSLGKSPHRYAVRYNEIRCLPTRKFPYLIHYYINNENNTVEILAVISTDRNPKIWEEKSTKPV